MRKALFFIGVLVLTNLLAGCSKDKDENPLIGKWESDIVTETFYGRSSSLNVKGQETFTFYADKKVEYFAVKPVPHTLEGTYTTQGPSLAMTFTIPGSEEPFVYGPGWIFPINLLSGESCLATVTKQTYQVNGDNLTIELTADAPFQKETTYVLKTVYRRVKITE